MWIKLLDTFINISTYIGSVILPHSFYKIYIDKKTFRGYLLKSNNNYKNKIIIYCHGGGYVFGNAMHSILLFDEIIKDNPDLNIFSLEYTLENPRKAFLELVSCISYFKYYKNIYLMGTSAGGHLVLKYCINNPIYKTILLSPWINPNHKVNTYTDYVPPLLINNISKRIKESNLMHKIEQLNNSQLKKLRQKIFLIYGDRECFKNQIELFIKFLKPNYFKGLNMPHAFMILPFTDNTIKREALLNIYHFL